VTTHASIGAFVEAAPAVGLRPVVEVNEVVNARREFRALATILVRLGVGRRTGLLSERSTIVFERVTPP
jgi:hypothetical protein